MTDSSLKTSEAPSARFWEEKRLDEMTAVEWESLCDGCGKCCMSKLIDDDTEEIHYTTVACRLFDAAKCRCRDYDNRLREVADCVKLTPQNVTTIPWLPNTCAYRLIAEGKPLFYWHPLISGSPETVFTAGIAMRDRVTAWEDELQDDTAYLDHVVDGDL